MLLHLGLLMYGGGEGPAQYIETNPLLGGKKRVLSTLIQGQCIVGVFWLGMVCLCVCVGKSDH